MAIESKLVKKLAKRARWSKYRERGRLSEFDKVDKIDNVIADSPRILRVLRAIQRKFDKVFGANVISQKPTLQKDLTATSVERYDFGTSDYGIRVTLPAGYISNVGIRPQDIAYILSDSLIGRQLEVSSVVDSTHLRCEDVSTWVVAGVAEVTSITAVADVSGSLNDTYFVINSALDAISYYCWYNVDSLGTDPAIPGKTGVEIAIASDTSAINVAIATAAALNALAAFVVPVPSIATFVVTNASTGATTNAVDTGLTGFTISIAPQGVTYDPTPAADSSVQIRFLLSGSKGQYK